MVLKKKKKASSKKKKKSRQTIGKMARLKGKLGEREVAKLLCARGLPARRGVQFAGDPEAHDVVCDDLKMFNLEVKRTRSLDLYKFLRQSTQDCGQNQVPTVWYRNDNQPWVVIMDAQNWISLAQVLVRKVDSINVLESFIVDDSGGHLL